MFRHYFYYLKNFDWILLLSVLLLVSFGLTAMYTIGLGVSGNSLINFKKQIIFAIIGFVILFIFAFLDYKIFYAYSFYIYILAILLLVIVLFLGKTVNGTTGWLGFKNLTIQPVEFAKLALIIVLAKFFSKRSNNIDQFKNLLFSIILILPIILLILLQPDFGSAIILLIVWFAMLFFFGTRKRYYFITLLLFILLFSFSWFFLFKPYQKQRIKTFINPNTNVLVQDYNIIQAKIAVGAGGFSGRALNLSSQSQLKFLPSASNDFIYAVICEELGFLGISLLFTLFIVFYVRLIRMMFQVKDSFGLYLLIGSFILFFTQTFINIGMNIGITPVVGISLPFLSSGGSFLIICLIIVGIVENIYLKSKTSF